MIRNLSKGYTDSIKTGDCRSNNCIWTPGKRDIWRDSKGKMRCLNPHSKHYYILVKTAS